MESKELEYSYPESNNITNLRIKALIQSIVDDIFFIQQRFGKDDEIFDVYKIRTMTHDASTNVPSSVLVGNKEANDSRIIESRKWMRRTGFDELPQIINIIKGDMNLFGSRPMDKSTYNSHNESQKIRRKKYKPGLFGGYAFHNKGKGFRMKSGEYRTRTNRENQDIYLRLRSIIEKKGYFEMMKFNSFVFIENFKAILKGVNR